MTVKLSRQKLARYLADQLLAGRRTQAVDELAAYLLETGRTKEADQIVLSTQELLESDGYVMAEVTTASLLAADMQATITQLLGAKNLELKQTIDPSVIGGIKVRTPSRVLDATVARRLNNLRESKV